MIINKSNIRSYEYVYNDHRHLTCDTECNKMRIGRTCKKIDEKNAQSKTMNVALLRNM